MHDLLFIPGAWSTTNSFNYMVSVFSKHPNIKRIYFFEYDAYTEQVSDVISRANETLDKFNKNTIIVGHSLGGIVATSIVKHKNVSKIMTISSPLAGLKFNKLVYFYLSHQIPILDDISEDSKLIKNLHSFEYNKPMTILVSTKGFNPIIFEPNDGIVTVSSQINWKPPHARVKEIPTSHHEILQSSDTIVELGRLLH